MDKVRRTHMSEVESNAKKTNKKNKNKKKKQQQKNILIIDDIKMNLWICRSRFSSADSDAL